MSSNTDLWDRLGKTDPAHTKAFQRAGGFKGTAIKPMWSYHRMTEEYGPCGVGWGIGEPSFKIIEAGGEVLVYCIASVWHGKRENVVYGVGGDKALAKFSSGLKTDDEALKKAFTDGVTNALKMIGVGADVHMGLFDDSKYVSEMKAEYARPNPHTTTPEDIFDGEIDGDIPPTTATANPRQNKFDPSILKVKDARPAYSELLKEMQRYQDPVELKEWAEERAADIQSLPGKWPDAFRIEYTKHKQSITNGKAA